MSETVSPSVPRAMLWMVGALLSFAAMAIAGRELSSELTLFQILFLRSAICLCVLVPLAARVGWDRLATPRPFVHLARNSVIASRKGSTSAISVKPPSRLSMRPSSITRSLC